MSTLTIHYPPACKTFYGYNGLLHALNNEQTQNLTNQQQAIKMPTKPCVKSAKVELRYV